jgi:hypothetical protein
MIPATRGAILVGLLAPLFAAGCFSPNSVTCGDGRICQPGSRCDDVRHRCITTAQELPCAGQAEDDGCTFANVPGACRAGVCEPFFCGDGIIEGLESCDGAPPPGKSCLDYGFDRGFLGCTATCELSFEKCGSFGWTNWSIPGGANLTGVWASSAEDVYVVGTGILHWDGSRWSTAMMDKGFADVWGSGPTDVYAVGSGVLAHWDGAHWSTWDGSRWITVVDGAPPNAGPAGGPGSGSFESVWGSGPDDVYAVGSGWDPNGHGAFMVHWNGQSWSQVADAVLQTASNMTSVWGTGPGDVFVAGEVPDPVPNADGYPTYHHVIFHWDGSRWSNVFTPESAVFYGFAGSGRNDVFAVGFSSDGSAPGGATAHWDGTSWSMVAPAPEQLAAAWAGGGEVLALGWTGAVFKWDGGGWVTVQAANAGAAPSDVTVGGIYGIGGNVFAVGPGPTNFRRDSSKWSAVTSGVSGQAVWASGPDDAYAVGPTSISHWDGTQWAPTGPAMVPVLRSVWGSGPDDVFAVGDQGIVAHWDGRVWSQSAVGPEFQPGGAGGGPGGMGGKAGSGGLGGAGAGASSGAGGTAGTGTGGTLGDLVSVWGSGPGDVFAVSTGRDLTGIHSTGQWALVHGNGASWSTVVSPDPLVATGVWGSGPDDVFVVGSLDNAGIYHWNGAVLSPMNVPNPANAYLSSVWGSGPNDVFAVGGDAILHWDGAQWSDARSGNPQLSYAVTVGGSGPGDVFVGGYGDVLLHRRGGTWEPVRFPGWMSTGLSVTPGRVFVVGGSGEVHLDRPSVTCVAPERDCNDGWDNDCDGLPDGADPDCAGKVVEQCANLADDDGDGRIDCADPDCAEFPSCKGPRFEQCDDLVDNDGDGKIDCADPDCAEFPACKVGGADGGAGGAGGVTGGETGGVGGVSPLGSGGAGGPAVVDAGGPPPPPPSMDGAPPPPAP